MIFRKPITTNLNSGPGTKESEHESPMSPSSLESPLRKSIRYNNIIFSGGLGHGNSSPQSPLTPIPPEEIARALDLYASQFQAGQSRSLSGVALRSFILGLVSSTCLILSIYIALLRIALWRVPFFIFILCLFHFLEYWTTARANSSVASVSSFLLTNNGAAYNIAHSCALLEMILTHLFYPRTFLPERIQKLLLLFGTLFIIIGQITRALAILTAGPSFSHIVAHHKRNTHVLVTHGIYSILRHPSYFGFFWWGIGTQLLCRNVICLIGYAIVLYWFFKIRIEGEEKLLVDFFGKEYADYARRTVVAIPGLD
ncbi:Protein-S-isoprenylcysteine O-methyltransferase [Golovinomyces cichoracearum]|uniref:Protein-S-isoprenylcysteine O-methyltransferase n=1 Tax=Golovinomyces cichoracearum TaxID=62708 RepID=A0A420I5Y6_9PEZI|nr:Protein-S-isoprenylcysteine O-methyltransferase [Golovinomyces cichoracearum]